ncbi:helix-turn-helix transcriptional regulator [Caballeronia sp. LZ035]|uniref:helix-turn-helix domain-containing protein n=1 Tax=Caballeronia sp. LZ035 TaxID=3038568 RepID=UPI0028594CA1|nr:helix-turn-helix transcriptional regulator [Caballeronia sp. LZ035]MDR5756979.1 helix-turn-helix transcriptional regulator [Caballeronia sp. LZ035]
MDYDRYRTLAELVRGARLIEEMTLEELAKASGTSKSYLSEIENGVSWRVSVQLADRLADALSISLSRIAKAAHESEQDAIAGEKK